MCFHSLFLRYERFLLKNSENYLHSMRNIFFAEFFLKRSFEKFNIRDYRKADAYEYQRTII